jgi:hypothetical protein
MVSASRFFTTLGLLVSLQPKISFLFAEAVRDPRHVEVKGQTCGLLASSKCSAQDTGVQLVKRLHAVNVYGWPCAGKLIKKISIPITNDESLEALLLVFSSLGSIGWRSDSPSASVKACPVRSRGSPPHSGTMNGLWHTSFLAPRGVRWSRCPHMQKRAEGGGYKPPHIPRPPRFTLVRARVRAVNMN